MDYFYEIEAMNYFYNNIFNNIEYMDLEPFSYINNASYGNKVFIGEKTPEVIKKKKKKLSSNIDVKVNNIYRFYNNNFIRNPEHFNYNYMDKWGNQNNLNQNLFRTANNFYGKFDIHNPTETSNPYQNKLQNKPYIYQKIYPEIKQPNKIYNKNNNMNKINNIGKKNNALKKAQNMNNKKNNKINDNSSALHKKNNHFANIEQINNKFKQKIKNPKNNNIINKKKRIPNNKFNLKENAKREKEIKEIERKNIESDEDEYLSNLADELLNACAKINNEERIPDSKPNKKPENEKNNNSYSESRKIIKKNFSNFIFREISVNINKDKIIEFDINLNKKIEDKIENENQNVINDSFPLNSNKDDNNIKENRNCQSKKDVKIDKDKDLIGSTYSFVKIVNISIIPKIKIDDNFHLGEKLKNKKDRRIIIDTEKNVYFNFLKDDIINACQVKKGILGDWEHFKPKKEEDIFDSRKIISYKSCIKKFDKEEIKIDKDYKYCENMEEREILPEFYDDEEKGEIIEEAINELGESLRSSIDKSTDLSKNDELLRSSINYSYNQSLRNSLMTSINNEGQGIISKLKAAFEASLNHEL